MSSWYNNFKRWLTAQDVVDADTVAKDTLAEVARKAKLAQSEDEIAALEASLTAHVEEPVVEPDPPAPAKVKRPRKKPSIGKAKKRAAVRKGKRSGQARRKP